MADVKAATSARADAPLEGAAGPEASPEAARALAALRAHQDGAAPDASPDATRILPAGLARAFRRVEGRLRPQFSSSESGGAKVLLPTTARGAFRLEDRASGLGVEVTLDGARDVSGEVSDGYLVYPGAHATGGTLLHRALPTGLEDYLGFDTRPRRASVSYTFTPGTTVKGLRLVANTLELVDAGGAPRLRVEPPYVVGADGVRTSATLAVEGCAVDRSPAAPWGRAPTQAGRAHCGLRVSWPAGEIAYPAVLDPRWTSTTTMKAKRQNHTATLLSTGKVLVVGGTDGTTALNTAELFDPATGTWTATPTFTGGRQLHTAVQLGTNANATTSGKVLIAGGWSGATTTSGAAVNTALLYNVTAGTWSSATVLNAVRAMHTATVLPNGQVLVAGGMSDTTNVLNTAALYDPTTGTGTWTATGTMALKARFHTATLMPTTGPFANKVVVAGGNTGGTTSMAVIQVFSGTTWTSAGITQLPAAREGHTATLLANGNLLVTGGKVGTTAQSSTLLFNAATAPGTWASAGTMSVTHAGHTATLLSTSILSSGQVLVAGGAPTTTSSAELWNGTTTWTATTALPSVIAGHTATLLGSKLVLLAGGTSAAGASVAQLYDPSFALACTSNSQCGTGFCASGVCCDTACNGGCGACNLAGKVGTCSPVSSTTSCRAAATGGCDVAETCNGTALTCPTDAFAANTVTCRAAVVGGCDVAEKCTGTAAACPADTFATNTVTCRTANGACDVAEKCTGTSNACPADAFAASSTVCRAAAAGGCDVAEKCTGTAAACPADALAPNTTVCRLASGLCDAPEKCTGISTVCPGDGFLPNTTVCRAAMAGGCDVAEKCPGTSGACPTDAFLPSTTVCRAAVAGGCDVAEKCPGTSNACPTDAFLPSTTVCRAAVAGGCDVAEKCPGTSNACPLDAFLPSTTVCRAAVAGGCDVAEKCPGTSGACPTDGFAPPTTVCRPSTGQCDVAETCAGTSTSCPTDSSKPNGTLCDDGQKCTTDACLAGVCRGTNVVCTPQDQCHLAGSCNPTTGACFKPEKLNGTLCDDGNPATNGEVCEVGVCRTPASYQKASAFQPEDLGTLGGSITNPTGMNGYGQIVGSATHADGVNHAFTWSKSESIKDLGASPGFPVTSIATDINDSNVIAGTLTMANGSHHAFRYASATLQDLGPAGDDQPDQFGDRGSYVNTENASGDLAGFFSNAGDVRGFRYRNGAFEDVGTLNGRQTFAYDMSDAGVVVGASWVPNASQVGIRKLGHAFMRDDAVSNQPVDLNSFVDPTSGWTLVNAKAISPNGKYIVGSGDLAGQLRAYRFNRTTGVLDEVSAGWTGDIFPYAVNDEGKVVGTGFPTAVATLTGWIYTDQVGFQNLNDIVGTSSGWTISVATAINAAGDLTGYGTHQGSLTRGFRLQMGTACPSACASSDQCHAGGCNPTTGACENVPKPNGTLCDDGNPATSNETCQLGRCRSPSSYPTVSNLAVDDLGQLGGGYSAGDGINSFGEVVGTSTGADGLAHAFDWQAPGSMVDLTAQPGFLPGSTANAINDDGTIAGAMGDPNYHVFRVGVDGVEDLGVLGDNSIAVDTGFNYQGAVSYDMNATGQLTGWMTKDNAIHGYRYTNGLVEDIGSLEGGRTSASSISDNGTVVGSSFVTGSPQVTNARRLGHAIMWTDVQVTPTDLNIFVDPLSGLELHSASGISPNGRYITGAAERNGVLVAFRLDTSLGTIDEVSNGWPGDTSGSKVNDNGDVAGWGQAVIGALSAFIYTDQIGFKKLNDIISPTSGWDLRVTNDINADGDIVGWGVYQGQYRGYRLHHIVTPQVACLGKAEGDSCDAGNFCGAHNVCHLGTCGGGDPADAFCLRLDGIVEDTPGKWYAVFGYDSGQSTIMPTVNQVLRDGVVVGQPHPAPPPWLPPGSHPGIFIPSFDGGQTISWRVNGQMITASTIAKKLPKVAVGGSGFGVDLGGTIVTIKPDLASYGAAPTAPSLDSAPPLGDRFYGTFEGSLSVGPTGAATYSVPVAVPPGIGGMAPKLSLVYSSQAGDGIAGQGWSLSGLSIIHACPKTRIQDGVAAPVTAEQATANNSICLDGKRLFEDPAHPGSYFTEVNDFSTIKKVGDAFVVTTKAGETRFYGMNPKSRVKTILGTFLGVPVPSTVVMWPMDRVVDAWGNYFDIIYNDNSDDVSDFSNRGLIPTEIKYTGNLHENTAPFYSVTFQYIPGVRKDQRSARFGNSTLPLKKLLTGITVSKLVNDVATPLTQYTLTYADDALKSAVDRLTLPSELEKISYCALVSKEPGKDPPCLPDLKFGWRGGGFTSMVTSTPTYKLPAPFDPYLNDQDAMSSQGSQFIDLDADGLPDVVQARYNSGLKRDAWRNTGAGFEEKPAWSLPNTLVDDEGQPGGSVIADIDGDGKPDFITHYYPANFPGQTANRLCAPSTQPNIFNCVDNPSVVVYLNRITPTCSADTCWKIDVDRSVVPWPVVAWPSQAQRINFLAGGVTTDSLADMNGDGRADFVRVVHPTSRRKPDGTTESYDGALLVLLNDGTSWQSTTQYAFNRSAFRQSFVDDYHLEDVNRDGLPDLVNRQIDSNTNLFIGVNTGASSGNVWRGFDSPTDPNWNATPETRSVGDITGDGFYDPMTFFNFVMEFGQSFTPKDYRVTKKPTITFGNGVGYTTAGIGPYMTALSTFGPDPSLSPFPLTAVSNYAFGMADLNADGLADVILNHSNGGQPLINTGSTWVDLNGVTARQTQAGSLKTAFVPTRVLGIDQNVGTPQGGSFLDINGDGVADLVRGGCAHGSGFPCALTAVVGETYLNTYEPPHILYFPTGLSRPAEVTYATITEKYAREGASPVYSDSGTIDPGTVALALPLRVVSAISTESGRGVLTDPAMLTTRYQYQSLRGSAYGRGPQGFKKVIVTEPSDQAGPDGPGTAGTRTETTYSQIFPYTGMPISVVKTKSGVLMSSTTTDYCDVISTSGTAPACLRADGPGKLYPPVSSLQSSLQVYPRRVTDISYPVGRALSESLQTISTTTMDAFANPTKVVVETMHMVGGASPGTSIATEHYRSTTDHWYGAGAGEEAVEGKATWIQVTGEALDGVHAAVVHKTALDYTFQGGFNVTVAGSGTGAAAQYSVSRLALAKTRVEPDSWMPETASPLQNETEVHTAYQYDEFGNIVVTTTCASDFGNCTAGAVNLASVNGDARYHPPFRTTRVSYNPNDWSAPPGSGPDLARTTGYAQRGRFPVRLINAESHVEYTLYDSNDGTLRQRSGPNWVTTCYRTDEFGQRWAEVDRCGSAHPLEATVRRHKSLGFGGSDYPIVTHTEGPGTLGTWSYSDDFGRSILSLSYGLDGHLVESGRTTYNFLGQVSTTAAPRTFPSGDLHLITHKYDVLGPERTTTRDLGQIRSSGENGTASVTRTFQGLTILTDDAITDEDPVTHVRTPVTRRKSETKNALGKVASVTTPVGDPASGTISYAYDADGNLTDTRDPRNNAVHIDYDARGRKIRTIDPDLGTWTYTYNGFGDLLEQTDAKLHPSDMVYDRLGRMTKRATVDGTAEWVYDVAQNGKGKLAAVVGAPDAKLNAHCQIENATLMDGNRSGRWFHYAPNGDVLETFECTDGTTASSQFVYDDTTGRQSRIIYPDTGGARLAVDYHYAAAGPLWYVSDASDNTVLWAATAVNAAGQVVEERTKNGIDTSRMRSPVTGWLLGSRSISHAENEKLIQDWSANFDEAGNLRSRRRQDMVNTQSSTEWFGYDSLDRLTKAHTQLDGQGASAYDTVDNFDYDVLGNLLTKGGQTYHYQGCGGRPHAVCSVGDGPNRSYDDNGNMTGGDGRIVGYNARNKPTHIVDSATVVDFAYDGDGNRVVQDVSTSTNGGSSTERTTYFGMGATGKTLDERRTKGDGSVEHTQFIYAGNAHGGAAFAVRVVETTSGNASTPETKYFHFDHIGSVTAISDDVGHVVDATWGNSVDAGVMGYDAWGARRSPEGRPADPKSFNPQAGHREFTGHETIPHVGLVNMNGRVYDPVLGRFLSPDPTIQFAANLQTYNRYSYVLNNPLSFTDPSGYHAVISKDWDQAITSVLMIAGMVACGVGGPVGEGVCIGLMVANTAWSSTTMKAAGADWGDIIAVEGFGLIAGFALGAAAGGMHFDALTDQEEFGKIALAKIAAGAISGALSGAVSAEVFGGGLGESVFIGAVQGCIGAAMAEAGNPNLSQAPESLDSILTRAPQGGVDPKDAPIGQYDEAEAQSLLAQRRSELAAAGPDLSGALADLSMVVQASSSAGAGGFYPGAYYGYCVDTSGTVTDMQGRQGNGVVLGARASAVIQVQFYNASCVDLAGPFTNISWGAGAGPYLSVDAAWGPNGHGGNTHGVGFSVGGGAGGGASVGGSNTDPPHVLSRMPASTPQMSTSDWIHSLLNWRFAF